MESLQAAQVPPIQWGVHVAHVFVYFTVHISWKAIAVRVYTRTNSCKIMHWLSRQEVSHSTTQCHLHVQKQTWTWKQETLPGPTLFQGVKVPLSVTLIDSVICRGVTKFDSSFESNAAGSKKCQKSTAKQSAKQPDMRASLALHPCEEDICALCGKPEDRQFQLFVRPAFFDGQRTVWVHDDCSLYSPEVYEGDLMHGCYLEVFGCLSAVRRSRMLK